MKYEKTARELLEKIGGAKNINNLTHCMTRLRITLKDESIVDDEQVQNIHGVLGVTRQGGQYQVVIGNEVKLCYQALNKLMEGKGDNSELVEPSEKQKITAKSVITTIISSISGSLSPLIPALIAGGMLRFILIICEHFAWIDTSSQNYAILSFISNTPYYFMPIMLAFIAAQRFHVTPMLAVMIAGVLLHPAFFEMYALGEKITFFGATVPLGKYAFSIFPIILMVWFMKYIEKWIDGMVPTLIKSFIQPLLIVLVSSFLALVIVGPIGLWLNNGFITLVANVQESSLGWMTLGIVAAAMPLIIRTGMHWILAPIFLSASKTSPDMLILPAMLISNLAQGSAALAVSIKTKEEGLKRVARQAGLSALVAGVTEPALYGVNSKLKKPLYATIISGAISGIYFGIRGVESYVFVVPSVVTLPQFLGENPSTFVAACVGGLLSIVLTFVLTWILWKSEAEVKENKVEETPDTLIIHSPLKGKLIPLEKVHDQVFSQKLMGDGVAVIPTNDVVCAPFDGTVSAIFPTKHAIGLTSEDGVEILIHVGINTVELNGRFFEVLVEPEASITKGQAIIKADFKQIQAAGYDITTPVIMTNIDASTEVAINNHTRDVSTEEIIRVKFLEGNDQ